jgi:hypothetical protein
MTATAVEDPLRSRTKAMRATVPIQSPIPEIP